MTNKSLHVTDGFFVSLEGIDGSGKTTQAPLVEKYLNAKGCRIIYTQEPTRGKIGLILREYLRDPTSSPFTDALLFAADRTEHYFNEIKPLLENGYIVLTDRYVDSSVVYQGSQGAEMDWVRMINSKVAVPDLSIYIDIPSDIALNRIETASRKNIEKFENIKALEDLKKRYQQIMNYDRVKRINGNKEIKDVTIDIAKVIIQELKLNI